MSDCVKTGWIVQSLRDNHRILRILGMEIPGECTDLRDCPSFLDYHAESDTTVYRDCLIKRDV